MTDYSVIDQSSLLPYIFYPRDDRTPCPDRAFDFAVTVEEGVEVFCRAYLADRSRPSILYFHGNGEVASDYDPIAPLFEKEAINLLVAEYRGYGMSSGRPTLTALARDCHRILASARGELRSRGFHDRPWVMGRSLGSISALELGFRDGSAVPGLIIESGFMCITSILRHLDLPLPRTDASIRRVEVECREMVRAISLPVLIIHGAEDSLVPLGEAEDLYEGLRSEKKELVVIPGADHNSLLFTQRERYFGAIRRFVSGG
jgi:hypothetical protein